MPTIIGVMATFDTKGQQAADGQVVEARVEGVIDVGYVHMRAEQQP